VDPLIFDQQVQDLTEVSRKKGIRPDAQKCGRRLMRNRALPGVLEVPDLVVDGPSRTRTVDPLIKREPESVPTEIHGDVKLDDLYTWD
jgi:hypothetical protein